MNAQTHVITLNDPEVQEFASVLAEKVIEQYDVERGIAVLVVATANSLIALLHMSTPMPEQNIQATKDLLDTLRRTVLEHSKCAMDLNGVSKKQKVH